MNEVFRFPGRATRAVIDLDAIAANLRIVRGNAGSGVAIMAVVKANGYGHGAIAVAHAAMAAGADYLAVATVDEAIQLRMASVRAPVLVLGPVDHSEVDLAIGHSIDLAVGSFQFAQAVALAAEQNEVTVPLRLHLKLDTGMHRFGAYAGEALEIARFIDRHPLLRLYSVFTHFARSDELDDTPTIDQSEQMDRFLEQLACENIHPEVVHQANSAAALRSRRYDRGMVRLGIALYGLSPSADVPVPGEARPALTIASKIARVFDLHPGDAVSYGATFRSTTDMQAALVPIGYADGYPRLLSGRSSMYVHEIQCQELGRVCMDQTVIGLPHGLNVSVGDPVVVAGAWSTANATTLDEIAAMSGTINYEIATRLTPRVPRFYLRSGKVVAVADLHGYRTLTESGEGNR